MIRMLTAGESHGQALQGILEGLPAGLPVDAAYINRHLARRQKGYGRGGRMKIENDKITILGGVRHGKTIGAPVGLLLENRDWVNWMEVMQTEPADKPVREVTLPRPGHADLSGAIKYGFDDIRNVIERSSARETAMRTALGTVCRRFLEAFNITISSLVTQIGTETLDTGTIESLLKKHKTLSALTDAADRSAVRCPDKTVSDRMVEKIKQAQKNGDSLGGLFEVYADGLKPGLGSYVHFDRRLDGLIAQAMASIQGVKGVAFGAGFDAAEIPGSDFHDEIFYEKGRGYYRKTNRSGGIEGGVTTGERIIVRAVMKPIPTLARPLQSVDIRSKKPHLAHKERTDSCSVPACSIVAEAMLAFVLTDVFLQKYGGDSLEETRRHYEGSP